MDELPEYATLIPLPYKISIVLCLGVYLWYSIIYINYRYFHINTLQLVSLSYLKNNYTQLDGRHQDSGEGATTIAANANENKQLLDGVWKNVYSLSLTTLVSLVVFHLFTWNGSKSFLTPIIEVLPLLTILFCVCLLFKWADNGSIGCTRVFTTMKRILVGGIASRTMRTNDILISDSLVSYARVLNDFVLYLWTLLLDDDVHPYDVHVESIALSLPIIIRIRQCWYEYKLTGLRQHLLNLIKYSTGFGPMLMTILIRTALNNDQLDKEQVLSRVAALNKWWYFFATINSTYSFIWDVKMDWGLQLFNQDSKHHLRPKSQLIGPAWKYYTIILLDFILRFLWIFKIFHKSGEIVNDHLFAKVGGFLFGGNAFQFGFTVLEVLEILRRWLWCFLKLESDWFKLQNQGIELEMVKEN